MKQINHALNRTQIIFLHRAFHEEAYQQSYESIIRKKFDKVYEGAATRFVLQWWDTNGADINLKWVELYQAVQDMIIELQSFIDEKNQIQFEDDANDAHVIDKNRKRKRSSFEQQQKAKSNKKRRRSSLTF